MPEVKKEAAQAIQHFEVAFHWHQTRPRPEGNTWSYQITQRCGTRKSLAVNRCISRAVSLSLQEPPPNTSRGNQRGFGYVKLFVALSAKCEKMKTVKPPRKSKQPTCIGLPVGMQRHHICTPRNLPTTAEQEPGPLHCRYDVEKIEHRNVKLEPVMVYRLFSRFVAICNAVLKDSIHCASMELSQTVEPLRIQFKLQKCTCRVRAKACPSQTEELYMLG